MPLPDYLLQHWLIFSAVFNILVALVASAQVILNKRDTRAAIAWVGLIWLTPLLGVALYFWLGINRIQRRARLLRSGRKHQETMINHDSCPQELLKRVLSSEGHHLESISKLVRVISNRPLLAGNAMTPLQDGEQAYPAMIHAMDSASQSIALSTYIFDNDRMGGLFLDSLKRALSRKVEVRVLIDDMGARYSWPTITQSLRKAGIRCTTFMPPTIPWIFQHTNLRTHRKLLVVDGTIGFTGGMNFVNGTFGGLCSHSKNLQKQRVKIQCGLSHRQSTQSFDPVGKRMTRGHWPLDLNLARPLAKSHRVPASRSML